ncbi:MAG TPA: hypothetical protein VMS60_09480 [Solirubrobacterales bacterium]|nr:hypothetical protein [Solirubrobacterales bacterium]
MPWIVAAIGGALLLSIALGGASAASDVRPARASTKPLERLLRLHDLPGGYRVLDTAFTEIQLPSIGCEAIDPADPQPRLARFLARYSPSGCLAIYSRVFRMPGQPGPQMAASGAMVLPSTEAAEAALASSRELLSHLFPGESLQEVPAAETVGDASRLFLLDGDFLFGSEDPSAIFVWRSGNAVAAVLAAVSAPRPSQQVAIELAKLQQAHVAAPTPYTPQEMDDREVALEDPALEVPVRWLGKRFAARRGLPTLHLYDSASTTEPRIRSPRAFLLYTNRFNLNRAHGVILNLWSPGQWKRLRASGRELPGDLHCARSRDLGRAVVYSGYQGRRADCSSDRPRTFTARIRYTGLVVTAETISICDICFGAGRGPYNSLEGMEAIAHNLELREPAP